MLHHLNWETLETHPQKLQLIMIYKIIHQLVEIDPSHFLTPTKPRPRSPHSTRFLQYSTSTDVMKFSFFPCCIPLWNNLPASVAEAHSLASFKNVKGLSYASRVLTLGSATEAGLVLPRCLKSNCVQLLSATSYFLFSI
jgi:hypothetical protein